jgi:hypothetical protein
MAPSKKNQTKVTKEEQPMKAGNTQDYAEAINLAAQEIKEEVDTVTTTTEPEAPAKPKKTRAKKVAPTPAPSPEPITEAKEESTAPETPSAHPLKDTTEDEPKKAKKPRAKKEKAPKEEKVPKEPKEKKRAPSAYNIFVKEIMPELKKENSDNDKTQRDLMKMAAERWNEHKAKNAAA